MVALVAARGEARISSGRDVSVMSFPADKNQLRAQKGSCFLQGGRKGRLGLSKGTHTLGDFAKADEMAKPA